MNQQLFDYITQSRQAGIADSEIKSSLIAAGWNVADIEEALISVPRAQQSPSLPTAKTEAFSFRKQLKIIVSAATLAIIVFGGYYAYGKFIAPQRVWAKMVQNFDQKGGHAPVSTLSQNDLQINISGTFNNNQSASATVGAKISSDLTDSNNKLSKTVLSLDYKLGASSFGLDNIQILTIGDNDYVDVSQIPFIKQIAADYGGWVKLNSNELTSQTSSSSSSLQNFDYPSIIQSHKFIGTESIGGIKTYHYQLGIDKAKLDSTLQSIFDKYKSSDTGLSSSYVDQYKSQVDDFINSIQINSADVWVGASDGLIHKVDMQVVFSSLQQIYPELSGNATMEIILTSLPGQKLQLTPPDKFYDFSDVLGSARAASSDVKRLADIRQMQTAVELFYNDAGGYPPAASGLPANSGKILINDYIQSIPLAPTPPGGTCTEEQNKYIYAPSGTGYTGIGGSATVYPSYTYTFCLGTATGGLSAGVHTASPSGIH